MINRLDPEEAVLIGTVEGGAVQLHEDKNIGTASHGCAVSSFVVPPFGNNFIHAEWQESTCEGGHIICGSEEPPCRKLSVSSTSTSFRGV